MPADSPTPPRPQPRPGAPRRGPAEKAPPGPTGRHEKRARNIVLIALALLVVAVLGFNLLAPRDRLQAPDAPRDAVGSHQEERPQATTTAPGDGSVSRSTPEAADTPTPAGRERMGAPALSNPQPEPLRQESQPAR
ncbi:hypothetical protein [Melaminivora alkalimesophila]|uniref:Uncharacterized protein n=1 Tax=Melaminivora alkalimesophila TaxID=1165852 RepID=A0A317RD76_9BURK|nr:hypothetical protein [Melaminivora alkalimesophila]PWW47866.1 hypothetical protein DFR36_102244 [Melaminivora alkalimesophila]